jgi:hypothetical protein
MKRQGHYTASFRDEEDASFTITVQPDEGGIAFNITDGTSVVLNPAAAIEFAEAISLMATGIEKGTQP